VVEFKNSSMSVYRAVGVSGAGFVVRGSKRIELPSVDIRRVESGRAFRRPTRANADVDCESIIRQPSLICASTRYRLHPRSGSTRRTVHDACERIAGRFRRTYS